ncbi:MAG TPA: hypothetical protein VJ691_13540 [Vicinamibacterales bacterium]|nr:hypothetical protein [Vicinamibacterales bacterium]
MTKLSSALLVLFAITLAACNRVDTSQTQASAGDPGPTSPANKTASELALTPVNNPTVAANGQPVNPVGAAVLEFHKRIEAYMKIHKEADSKVPSLKRTDDPNEISSREKALADMIMTLRPGAQTGDIFAKEYQPYFVDIVQEDFKQRSVADRKALVHELPKGAKVSINTVYPTTLPLITFPATLLRKLPDLPPELEYRIVGRHLLLRDVKANLIVDALYDVVPIPT